jgi:hypothetical protein
MEKQHKPECLAHAFKCALENQRDAGMPFAAVEALTWAMGWLVDGTCSCYCDVIVTRKWPEPVSDVAKAIHNLLAESDSGYSAGNADEWRQHTDAKGCAWELGTIDGFPVTWCHTHNLVF